MTISDAGFVELAPIDAPPDEVSRLLELIHARREFDLSSYKQSSLARSIVRRAVACKCGSVAEYRALVEADDGELDALLSGLMVGYSTFFRDPELFALLRDTVMPDIVRRARAASPPRIRTWTVACSTGQEAYSVAILLFEALSGRLDGVELKLFATDVDRAALAKARRGRYVREEVAHLDARTRARYFTGTGPVTVRPFLRRMVLFGEQNVFADPPISQLDLITCRNVLIYLQRDAQVRALENLSYGLKPGGALILGKSEKLRAEVAGRFDVIDKRWQVYRKSEARER
jgi:two-component system CheB/CheR fusion protein